MKMEIIDRNGAAVRNGFQWVPKNEEPHGVATFGKITTKWMKITPEAAAEILEKANNQNRRPGERDVRRIMKSMIRGTFQRTHQGLAFDINGVLIDGQHRLEAVKRTKTTWWMLVTEGLDPVVRKVIDNGKVRTAADGRQITIGDADAHAKAPLVNAIRRYYFGDKDTLGPDDLDDYIERFSVGIEWAMSISRGGRGNRFVNAAIVGAFVFAYWRNPHAVAVAYADLKDGSTGPEDPIRVLRDTILAERQGFNQGVSAKYFHLTLNALYSRLHKERVKLLREAPAKSAWFERK
jgi:hypothetical protein